MIIYRYTVPMAWYEGVYEDRKAPCKAGRPFTLKHKEGSDKAVLLIHGFTGYPGELVRPAEDLYGLGFDIYAPRLPGHGTTGEDFLRSDRRDWTAVAVNAARDLRKKYSTFYILGHSMGGALAVIAALQAGCDRLALAGPAVAYPGQKPPVPLPVIYLYSLVCKRKPNDWHNDPGYVMYYENAPADDLYLGSQYWSWLYPRQIHELLALMKETRPMIPSLSVDTLTVSGGLDTIIGEESSVYIAKAGKGHNKHVSIPGCTHYMFYDKDKDAENEAVKAVLDWFSA